MLFRTAICVIVAVAIILVAQTELHAKKGATARPAAATTTTTTTKAVQEEIDPKTGKARATQFEKGKPVAAKTKGQVNKITQSTGDLAAALRAKSGKTPPPPPPAKGKKPAKGVEEEEDEEVAAPRRKKSRTPATQPASQPSKPVKPAPPQADEDY